MGLENIEFSKQKLQYFTIVSIPLRRMERIKLLRRAKISRHTIRSFCKQKTHLEGYNSEDDKSEGETFKTALVIR